MWRMVVLLAVLVLASTTPAGSGASASSAINQTQEPRYEIVGTVNGWSIRDNHGTCSAYTSYEGGRFILLRFDVLHNSVALSVADPVWRSIQNGRTYQVRVLFNNGSDYPAGDAFGVNSSENGVSLTALNFHFEADPFLRDFAGARFFGLFMGDIRLGLFSLAGTRPVVERLRTCAAASNRRYPRDPFESAISSAPPPNSGYQGTLRPYSGNIASGPQRARANLGYYFSTDDYPVAALRNREEGTTAFELGIGSNGRVTECRITVTSGSLALDQATCRILTSRARYTPARDASGNPMASTDSGRVTWRLPAEPPPALPPDFTTVDTDPNPSRVWVQIMTAPDRAGVIRQYTALRGRVGRRLPHRGLWTAENAGGRRGLLGPFASITEAREFVGRLQAENIPAEIWISRRSEAVEPLDSP